MADGVQVKFGANITDLVEGINSAVSELRQLRRSRRRHVSWRTIPPSSSPSSARWARRSIAVSDLRRLDEGRSGARLANAIVRRLNRETLVKSVERLQVNLQHAHVPTSQQALALHAIGLSAQQMLAVPLPEQVRPMADAFKLRRSAATTRPRSAWRLWAAAAMEMMPESGPRPRRARADAPERRGCRHGDDRADRHSAGGR